MVKVTVEPSDSSSTFGLIWFPSTTKEYYVSQDEYGVGCYFTMPHKTIVKNLMPNVAYTFCLIDDQQSTVSPFSCKSVHISGNLETIHDANYSKSMRAKGISLMVFGVVIFLILGILLMFLVLRRKPIWLKGSKRIVKPKFSSGEVVVLPRTNTAKYLRQSEEFISQKKQGFNSKISRSNSTTSLDSTDSYINPNFYEIIPAYLTFDKIPQTDAPKQPEYDIYESCEFRKSVAERESVRYAQIKPRTMRISSDPLPAIPSDP
ncbi:uncharacterized protein LOC122322372 [Drosophila grimshawi]|uniref:uncharacterized protein LOC122322372 n=1 Tax=Drosophila grimshawi TaxID=7222 RepID=UPI001C9368A4|nr:uncharacterized protein LOC122322372 [Drosophila grimshawi]